VEICIHFLPETGKIWQKKWQKLAIKKARFYRAFLKIWQKLAKKLAKNRQNPAKIWQNPAKKWQKLPVFLPDFATFCHFFANFFQFSKEKITKKFKKAL